jgi:hypothetical protein
VVSSVLAVTVVAATTVGPVAAAGAQARARAVDPELLENGDVIRYRDLSREDFLADKAPAEVADFHGDLGAATCVFLTTDPEMIVRTTGDDRGLVYAQVENLRFMAFMDRGCSWWNPEPISLPDDYILQHEQIHFALFEIEARRLNRRSEWLTKQLQTVSSDRQAAVDELHRRIDVEIERAMAAIFRRSDDLDDDTSRTIRRDRQDWWWRLVNQELAELAAEVRQ